MADASIQAQTYSNAGAAVAYATTNFEQLVNTQGLSGIKALGLVGSTKARIDVLVINDGTSTPVDCSDIQYQTAVYFS
jgi:hypothetical protein